VTIRLYDALEGTDEAIVLSAANGGRAHQQIAAPLVLAGARRDSPI
jgi:hypothetical protein